MEDNITKLYNAIQSEGWEDEQTKSEESLRKYLSVPGNAAKLRQACLDDGWDDDVMQSQEAFDKHYGIAELTKQKPQQGADAQQGGQTSYSSNGASDVSKWQQDRANGAKMDGVDSQENDNELDASTVDYYNQQGQMVGDAVKSTLQVDEKKTQRLYNQLSAQWERFAANATSGNVAEQKPDYATFKQMLEDETFRKDIDDYGQALQDSINNVRTLDGSQPTVSADDVTEQQKIKAMSGMYGTRYLYENGKVAGHVNRLYEGDDALWVDQNGNIIQGKPETTTETANRYMSKEENIKFLDDLWDKGGDAAVWKYLSENSQFLYDDVRKVKDSKGNETANSAKLNALYQSYYNHSNHIDNLFADAIKKADDEMKRANNENIVKAQAQSNASMGGASASANLFALGNLNRNTDIERKMCAATWEQLLKNTPSLRNASKEQLAENKKRFEQQFANHLAEQLYSSNEITYILGGLTDNAFVEGVSNSVLTDYQRGIKKLAKAQDPNSNLGTNILRGGVSFVSESGIYKAAGAVTSAMLSPATQAIIKGIGEWKWLRSLGMVPKNTVVYRDLCKALEAEGRSAAEAEKIAMATLTSEIEGYNLMRYGVQPVMSGFGMAGTFGGAEMAKGTLSAMSGGAAQMDGNRSYYTDDLTQLGEQYDVTESLKYGLEEGVGSALGGMAAGYLKMIPLQLLGKSTNRWAQALAHPLGFVGEVTGMAGMDTLRDPQANFWETWGQTALNLGMFHVPGMAKMAGTRRWTESEVSTELIMENERRESRGEAPMTAAEERTFKQRYMDENGRYNRGVSLTRDGNMLRTIYENVRRNMQEQRNASSWNQTMAWTDSDKELLAQTPEIAKLLSDIYVASNDAKKAQLDGGDKAKVNTLIKKIAEMAEQHDRYPESFINKLLYRIDGTMLASSPVSNIKIESAYRSEDEEPVYMLLATDETGRVIDRQTFGTREQADDYAEKYQLQLDVADLNKTAGKITLKDMQDHYGEWIGDYVREGQTLSQTKTGGELTELEQAKVDLANGKLGMLDMQLESGRITQEEYEHRMNQWGLLHREMSKRSEAVQNLKGAIADENGWVPEQIDAALYGHSIEEATAMDSQAIHIGGGRWRTREEQQMVDAYKNGIKAAADGSREGEAQTFVPDMTRKKAVSGELANVMLTGGQTPETHRVQIESNLCAEMLASNGINIADTEELMRIASDTHYDTNIRQAAQTYLNAQEALKGVDEMYANTRENYLKQKRDEYDAEDGIQHHDTDTKEGKGFITECDYTGADGQKAHGYVIYGDPSGDGMVTIRSGRGAEPMLVKADMIDQESINITDIEDRINADGTDFDSKYGHNLDDARRGGTITIGEELLDGDKPAKVVGYDVQIGQFIVEVDGKQNLRTNDDIYAMRDAKVAAEVQRNEQSAAAHEQTEAAAEAARQEERQQPENTNATTFTAPGKTHIIRNDKGEEEIAEVIQISADGKKVHMAVMRDGRKQYLTMSAEELKAYTDAEAVQGKLIEAQKPGFVLEMDGKQWEVKSINQYGYVQLRSEDGEPGGMDRQHFQDAVCDMFGLPHVGKDGLLLKPTEEKGKDDKAVKNEGADADSDYEQAMFDIDVANEEAERKRQQKLTGRNEKGEMVSIPLTDDDLPNITMDNVKDVYDMLEKDGEDISALADDEITRIEGEMEELRKQTVEGEDVNARREAKKAITSRMNELTKALRSYRILLDERGRRQMADEDFTGMVDNTVSHYLKKNIPEWADYYDKIAKQLGVKLDFALGVYSDAGKLVNGMNETDKHIVHVNADDFFNAIYNEDITPDAIRKTGLDYLNSVLGHEITHTLFKRNPEDMIKLISATKAYLGDAYWEQRTAKLKNGVSAKDVDEEMCCDMMGQLLSDKAFIGKLLRLEAESESQQALVTAPLEKKLSTLEKMRKAVGDFFDKLQGIKEPELKDAEPQQGNVPETKTESAESKRATLLEQMKRDYDDIFNKSEEEIKKIDEKQREGAQKRYEVYQKQLEEEAAKRRAQMERRQQAWDKRINDARKEMSDDSEALDVLNDREPRTVEEVVASSLDAHSLLLKSYDAPDGRRVVGLDGETGFNGKDMKHLMYYIGSKENGGKTVSRVAEEIYQDMEDNFKSRYSAQDVRNTILDLMSTARSVDDIRHMIDNNRISEAEDIYNRNRDMEEYYAHMEEGESDKYSVRTKPAPTKTQKVYKLMRLGDDGKLYPLFIDAAEPTELGVWYDADAPDLDMLRPLASGTWLVDPKTKETMSYDDFYAQHPELFKGKQTKLPSKEAINWATKNGMRFMFIEDTARKQKRFDGENRKYWNLGINGSGQVSTFSMRPGWHAGTHPTMRQIGKGTNGDLRDDRFVWVEGEVSADKDYTAEAQQNPDKDMPERIPEDGFYLKATNADKKKSQADRVGWYVAGAFKANRIISDAEARSVIDKWNAENPDKPIEYDYDRESGKVFDGEKLVEKGELDSKALADNFNKNNGQDFNDAVKYDNNTLNVGGGKFSYRTEPTLQKAIMDYADSKDAKRLGWVKDNIDDIVKETSDIIDLIHKTISGDANYDEFAKKDPTMRLDWRDGVEKPVVTWVRNNIEYKYDMSADTFCINNEGLETVLASPVMADLMVHMADFTRNPKKKKEGERSGFTSDDYLRLYETLRDMGFVVPCKGCFDAAARFKMLPSTSQNFIYLVNEIIDERNKNPKAFDDKLRKMTTPDKADAQGFPTSASTQEMAVRIGVAGDQLTKHVDWTQLMSAEGQTKALSDWGGIFRAWQRTGAGRPKDKLLPEPYTGQIMQSTSTIIAPYGETTPSFRDMDVNVGTGLRRNSHSEFRPVCVVDEMQFMRDAWLKGLCVFKYMKELDDVRLFGNMGVKFNMSGFPAWHKDGKAAGLDANGNYAIAEESVGGREYIYEVRNGKRYYQNGLVMDAAPNEKEGTHYDGYMGLEEAKKHINKDVSLSSVAFSIPHLIKLMTDVPTPSDWSGTWGSLIPFHASGATEHALMLQGLGRARAVLPGTFAKEAYTDYDKGVTNFEDVQNDRYGEGYTVLLGKKKGVDAHGLKMYHPDAKVLENKERGVLLYLSPNAYKTFGADMDVISHIALDKNGNPVLDKDGNPTRKNDVRGMFYTLASEGHKIPHELNVDYNDKVRELGGDYAYKDAADYYVTELRKIGLLPRFDFDVPEQTFLEMCKAGNVDPHHPKLGWKGEGNGWNPCDSDAYYSMFCDYGMTDPETGKLAPHRPVLDGQKNADAFENALPGNYLEIIKDGVDRYTSRKSGEDERMGDAIKEYCKRSVEAGKMSETEAARILRKHGIIKGKKFSERINKSDPFVSNAARGVEGIKQEKATAEQWKKMLEKAGALKKEEDKWIGLSQWLNEQQAKAVVGERPKTISKDEIQEYIAENAVKVEDVKYSEDVPEYPSEVELDGETLDELDSNAMESFGQQVYKLMGVEDRRIFDMLDMDPYDDEGGIEIKLRDGEFDEDFAEYAEKILGIDENDTRYVDLNDPDEVYDHVYRALRKLEDMYSSAYNDEKYAAQEKEFMRLRDKAAPMNDTRKEYQTEGLENNKEIALTVPSIEPYKLDGGWDSDVHFDDEYTKGKTVAWIRFGDATDADGNKVLTIDEIQSRRHQDGREKGYGGNIYDDAVKTLATAFGVSEDTIDDNRYDYANYLEARINRAKNEEYVRGLINALRKGENYVPDAPFRNNWQELAMKRMLRYAAENGYDKVAWTGGMQQARRYGLSEMVDYMESGIAGYNDNGEPIMGITIAIKNEDSQPFYFEVNPQSGIIEEGLSDYKGKPLSEVIGKDNAEKLLEREQRISGRGLDMVGGEGMKGFYDYMLPKFMNKYGKKWGAQTHDIFLEGLSDKSSGYKESVDGKSGLTMHAVDVTPEMKNSVMQGQVMFSTRSENFKKWFGDWENDPEHASKVVDENGEPLVVYHETNKDWTIADVSGRHSVAGKHDYLTPFGVFLKPTDKSIGIGKKQMALYADIKNPLEVADRDALADWLRKNIKGFDGFERFEKEGDEIENSLRTESDRLMLEGKFKESTEKYEEFLKVRKRNFNALATIKKNLDKKMRKTGYDGIHIIKDEGSRGRSVETWIALNPTQIKSATDNNGEYSRENPDIRYSERTGRKKLRQLVDVTADPKELSEEGEARMEIYRNKKMVEARKAIQEMSKWNGGQIGNAAAGAFQSEEGVRGIADADKAAEIAEDIIPLLEDYRKTVSGELTYHRIVEKKGDNYLKPFYETLNDINDAIDWYTEFGKGGNNTIDDHYGVRFSERKERQAEIIRNSNPKDENLGDHTWIESADDIKTFDEAVKDEFMGTPDFTLVDAAKALRKGKITVYSSYPIENGTFVTPSKMEAENYAGEGKVYSKELNLDDVAWIDSNQGQVAKVEEMPVSGTAGNGSTGDEVKYSGRQNGNGVDAQQVVIDTIKQLMDNKLVSAMQKQQLNRLMNNIHFADQRNLMDTLRKVQRNVRDIESKVIGKEINDLLNLKNQDVNGRNMSIAKNVDNLTRQVMNEVKTRMYGVTMTDEDEEISRLGSELWHLRDENRQLQKEIAASDQRNFPWTPGSTEYNDAKAKIQQNEQTIADKKDLQKQLKAKRDGEVAAQIWNNGRDIEKQIDDLQQKLDDSLDPANNVEWTDEDQVQWLSLDILKDRADIENDYQDWYDANQNRINATTANERRAWDAMCEQIEMQRLGKQKALRDKVQQLVEGGKESLARLKEAQINHRRELIDGMMTDIRGNRGKRMPADPEKVKDRSNGTKMQQIMEGMFASSLKSFEYMAHAIDRNHFSRDGWFYNYFVKGKHGVMAAENSYLKNYEQSMKTLTEKTEEIFGKKAQKAADDGTKKEKDHGITMYVENPDGSISRVPMHSINSMEPIEMTKNRATYLYMVSKMGDGMAKLLNMGIDEQSIDEIKNFIGQQRIDWADYVQSEYLPSLYPRYNKKYTEIYGTPMASIENYVPLRIDKTRTRKESDLQDNKVGRNQMQQKNSFQINRTINLKPIDLTTDCFEVVQKHVKDAEEFNAFADIRRDLDDLFSSNGVINQLNANHAGQARDLQEAAKIAVHSEAPEDVHVIEKSIMQATKGIIGGNIAYRIGTALKQTLSAPVFYGYTGDPRFIPYMTKSLIKNFSLNTPGVVAGTLGSFVPGFDAKGKLITNLDKGKWSGFYGDMKWAMDNIPSFKNRVSTGDMGNDIMNVDMGFFDKFLSKGMTANQLIDAVTCVSGIKAIYDYEMMRNEKKVKAGLMTQEEAHNAACTEADIFYNGTQQSSHRAFMSPVQTSQHALQKAVTAYQNASIGFARKAVEDVVNLYKAANRQKMIDSYARTFELTGMDAADATKAAEKAWAKNVYKSTVRLGMFGFLANFLWDLGGRGLFGFFQNDEQKESAFAWQNIPGYFMRGTYGSNIVNGILQGSLKSPFLLYEELGDAAEKAKKLYDDGGMSPELAEYAFIKAMRIPGVDLEVMSNIYLGAESLAGKGATPEERMLAMEFLINLAKTNRKSTAAQIYKDMPLDEQAKVVLRAGKVFEETDWRKYLPGASGLTEKKYNEVMTELAKIRMSQEELDAQPMSEKEMDDAIKHLKTEKDLEEAFNGTTDETLRGKIISKAKEVSKAEQFNQKTWAQRAADWRKKQEKKMNAGQEQKPSALAENRFKGAADFRDIVSEKSIEDTKKELDAQYKKYDNYSPRDLTAEQRAVMDKAERLDDVWEEYKDTKAELAESSTDVVATLKELRRLQKEAQQIINGK